MLFVKYLSICTTNYFEYSYWSCYILQQIVSHLSYAHSSRISVRWNKLMAICMFVVVFKSVQFWIYCSAIFFPMLFLHWFIPGCKSQIRKLDEMNSPTHLHNCWHENLFQYWLGFIMFNGNVPNFIDFFFFEFRSVMLPTSMSLW